MGMRDIYYEEVCMSNLRHFLVDSNSRLLAIVHFASISGI